uniref:BED-type domain-containing protein n=1 Tax=Neolamprologus brichardi TaxID=32507 RepID=A0A3Q4G1F6_NEOBR
IEGERCSFFSWKYSHYFEFLSTKDFNIKVHCTLCVGEKVLSTFKNTTSNLKKHLESQHGTVKLTESHQKVLHHPNNKSWILKLVAQYIVEEMLPINTVDSPSFRAIIKKIPTSVNAEKEFTEMERNLKAALNEIDFRHKVALACRRIRGRYTYDIIGTEIENIHSSYGLLNKVVATVTDNGSNFVNAFQEESTPKDDDVTFSDLSEILSAENESDGQLSLPPHHRCREQALWTKLSRSALASETVEEISKRKLLMSTSTRWNSFFDAVKRIAEIPMGELNTLCTKLGLKCFKDQEYQFLHEYCMAMKPLTAALDILQGDCPYGTLLPTLEVLMHKNIDYRFAGVLDDKDALLARVKQLLTAECCTTAPVAKNPASVPSATTSSSQGEMDFFTFEAEPEEETYSAEKEVMDYLMSGYDLQILHYNTPTPSSAPVERLFSLGGLVLTPKRNRLSDKRFEKLLLMRYNHWFTRSTLLFPP